MNGSVIFDAAPPQAQFNVNSAPFHKWIINNGNVWTLFFRLGNDYLLRFPNLADFKISSDGRIVKCFPVPGASQGTIEHLYLNQALPLALSQQGKSIFHASAVELNSGAAAFMASTGKGKSTLAASFAIEGYRLLTDDGLHVEETPDGFCIHPGHPSIRLWEDSRQAIGYQGIQISPAVQYTSKARLLTCENLSFCNTPQPLNRVYFLGNGKALKATFHILSPRESLIELLKHSFLLDIKSHDDVNRHIDRLSRMVINPIYFRLDYPRKFELLENVRADLIEHAKTKP